LFASDLIQRALPAKKENRGLSSSVGGDKRDRTSDLLNAIQATVFMPKNLPKIVINHWFSEHFKDKKYIVFHLSKNLLNA